LIAIPGAVVIPQGMIGMLRTGRPHFDTVQNVLLNVLNEPFNEPTRIIDQSAKVRREMLDEVQVGSPAGIPEIAAESLNGICNLSVCNGHVKEASTPPNGWRLSCRAESECPQTEAYHHGVGGRNRSQ